MSNIIAIVANVDFSIVQTVVVTLLPTLLITISKNSDIFSFFLLFSLQLSQRNCESLAACLQ